MKFSLTPRARFALVWMICGAAIGLYASDMAYAYHKLVVKVGVK